MVDTLPVLDRHDLFLLGMRAWYDDDGKATVPAKHLLSLINEVQQSREANDPGREEL